VLLQKREMNAVIQVVAVADEERLTKLILGSIGVIGKDALYT